VSFPKQSIYDCLALDYSVCHGVGSQWSIMYLADFNYVVRLTADAAAFPEPNIPRAIQQ
jgi:hypothetical protein